MLVPDLKADGSELYGKGLLTSLTDTNHVRHRARPEIDEIFFDLTAPKNFPKIEKAANKVVNLANRHAIALPIDDPLELRIRPNGRWQFMSVDLYEAQTEPVQSDSERERRIENNTDSLETVLTNLYSLRDALVDH